MTAPHRLAATQDGHRLIAYTRKSEGGGGSYPSGIGLFAAPEGTWHAFAVWTVIDRPEGMMVESGDYAQHLPEALRCYTERGGEL